MIIFLSNIPIFHLIAMHDNELSIIKKSPTLYYDKKLQLHQAINPKPKNVYPQKFLLPPFISRKLHQNLVQIFLKEIWEKTRCKIKHCSFISNTGPFVFLWAHWFSLCRRILIFYLNVTINFSFACFKEKRSFSIYCQ